MGLIQLLIVLAVLGFCVYLFNTIPMNATIKMIANFIVVIAAIVILLQFAGFNTGMHVHL